MPSNRRTKDMRMKMITLKRMNMRTRLCALVALLTVAAGSMKAQLYDQWASMEYKQWSFSPDSYYYSRVWRRIINMPWPLPDVYGWKPGNGYHDRGIWIPATGIYIPVIFNPYAAAAGHWEAVYAPDGYVNERWRQQLTLRTPAAAESVLYKLESNKEEDYWNNIRNLDVMTIADRMGVLSGLTGAATVTGTERQEAMDVVNGAYDDIQDEDMRKQMMGEYDALQERVSVINSAHMDNARKVVAMQELNRDYKELAKRVTNTLAIQYFKEVSEKPFKKLYERHQWVFDLATELGVDNSIQEVMNLVDLNKL